MILWQQAFRACDYVKKDGQVFTEIYQGEDDKMSFTKRSYVRKVY